MEGMDFTSPAFIQTAVVLVIAVMTMAFLLRHYTMRLEHRIEDFLKVENDREEDLRARERLVIAAALEGELMANQTKLEAFLLIYQELLRNLKEPGRAPKYKQGGEIIHDKPALSRTIFDAYATRLELVGPNVAGNLARIYADVDIEPEYKTLSPEMSPDQAIRMVEIIVENAKKLLDPVEKSIASLGVIVRDKRRSTGQF